eukprot:6213431-Pleurochrysis_carterae.AAC.2
MVMMHMRKGGRVVYGDKSWWWRDSGDDAGHGSDGDDDSDDNRDDDDGQATRTSPRGDCAASLSRFESRTSTLAASHLGFT